MGKKKVVDKKSGIEYDSTHEMHFAWYLDELKEAGYIKHWSRATPYSLSDKVQIGYVDARKGKKAKSEIFVLLKEAVYTPDFMVVWDESALGLFIEVHSLYGDRTVVHQNNLPFRCIGHHNIELNSTIDVKNPYNRQGVKTLFSIKQKWVFEKYKVFIQDIETAALFGQTFTPERYHYNDEGNKPRKVHNARTLQEYIAIRRKLANG